MRFEHVDCNLQETEPVKLRSVLASHLKMLHCLFGRCNFCSSHLHAPLCGVMGQGIPTKLYDLHELQEWLFF
jgi:hypothetical protein